MRKFTTAAVVAAATIGITFAAPARALSEVEGQQKAAAPAAAPTKVTVYKSPT